MILVITARGVILSTGIIGAKSKFYDYSGKVNEMRNKARKKKRHFVYV